MKFRGRLVEMVAIKKFYNMLCTMAKLAKTCVMRLTANKVYFILNEMGSGTVGGGCGNSRCGAPVVWAELEQTHFFSEYNMEGVTKESPEIFLDLDPDKLAKTLSALKTSHSVRSLKIKLTRKHESPCLTFEIENAPSAAANANGNANPAGPGRICVHDVPISLIPRRLWPDLAEPEMPEFDVSVYFPQDLKQLKHMVERYKSLGGKFTVHANRNGHLKLALETDEVQVITHFKDLEMPRLDATSNSSLASSSYADADVTDAGTFYTVRVDLRRFSLFLAAAADQVAPKRVIVNLVSGKMIHIFLVHEDVNVQYFIPGMIE